MSDNFRYFANLVGESYEWHIVERQSNCNKNFFSELCSLEWV